MEQLTPENLALLGMILPIIGFPVGAGTVFFVFKAFQRLLKQTEIKGENPYKMTMNKKKRNP